MSKGWDSDIAATTGAENSAKMTTAQIFREF